mmetsp:Transcript_20008/g.60448  ORF Transcript_20008/g.60448 Transcript_20008/m.60448 type:complete len:384 (+) Transcript_20008:327-1478(+)
MASQHRPAPMDKGTTLALNLQVLKRLDPATQEILASAGQVALYDLNDVTKAWIRRDVEGALFLLRRSSNPTFQFTILNRKSQSNYHEEVHAGFDFEEQNDKYMLYTNAQRQVRCLWFHSAEERAMLAKQIRHITAACEGGPNSEAADQTAQEPVDKPRGTNLLAHLQGRPPSGDSSNGIIRDLFSKIKLAPGVQPHAQRTVSTDMQQTAGDGVGTLEAGVMTPESSEVANNGQSKAAQGLRGTVSTGCTVDAGNTKSVRPVPLAQTSRSEAGNTGGVGSGSSTPGGSAETASRPPLLTPSFFKRHQQQQQQSLGFCRREVSGPMALSPGGAATSPTQASQPLMQPNAMDNKHRTAVRDAIHALADHPDFIDIVVASLKQSGAL